MQQNIIFYTKQTPSAHRTLCAWFGVFMSLHAIAADVAVCTYMIAFMKISVNSMYLNSFNPNIL